MTKLTIHLDEPIFNIIKKRAKKNLLTSREQIEDIVRRSAVSYKNQDNLSALKPDDKLIAVFSRENRGRKPKKKKKGKKK